MKKKLSLLPIVITLGLSGCSVFGYKYDSELESTKHNNTSQNNNSEKKDESEISTKDSYILDGKRLLINTYGDYVKYEDENKNVSKLESDHLALKAKIKGQVNGNLQTNYQKGLLNFFDINNKIRIVIDISSSELHKLDNDFDSGNTESYRMCNVDIYLNGLVYHYEEVGIRQKGNLSRRNVYDGDNIHLIHYKLSFEETFDDVYTSSPKTWNDPVAKAFRLDRKFFGLSKVDLRWNRNKDTTYVREHYAYEMYRENGGLSPRTNLCSLSMKIDGNTQNLGVYLMVETINKSFIKRNFVDTSVDGDL